MNLSNLKNNIYYEKYASEIETFNKLYKGIGINKNMLFYNIKNNKLRSLISFLDKNHFRLNWNKGYNFFDSFKVVIIGLDWNDKSGDYFYILEITDLTNDCVSILHCPMLYIGKGNKINWKKEKENE